MQREKKYTAITGASSGIGYAAAKAFAARGENLILVARRKERLEVLREELRKDAPDLEVVVRSCDLSILSGVYQLYDDLKPYRIETWINNAGFGDYNSVANQDLEKTGTMLRLNVEALTILSSLYVRDYKDVEGAQLINVSSRGGYVLVPDAVTYCATKFYVGAFTEGLAYELKAQGACLRAKVLAPAATRTEFGMIANDAPDYDYDERFDHYHTSGQMAGFLLQLYDSEKTVGIVDWQTFEFSLREPVFDYAGGSTRNQKI